MFAPRTFNQLSNGLPQEVIAAWTDGIPQVTQYDPPPHVNGSAFPAVPEQMTEEPERLLMALHNAVETADAEAVRYTLNHVQLDALKRLPSPDEYNLPITVDLNGAAVIRESFHGMTTFTFANRIRKESASMKCG